MSPKPNSPSSSHELIGRVYPFSILDFGFIVGRAFGGTTHDGEKGFESKALSLITPPNCAGGCWDLFAIDRYRGTRVIRCESAHHDIDGVALIKGGAIVNAAGVVTIVTAVGNRAIGPWESAVVACRESAPKADSAVATDASASIASTGYGKAAPSATRSHPAECFIGRQKESRGSEENSDVLTERVP